MEKANLKKTFYEYSNGNLSIHIYEYALHVAREAEYLSIEFKSFRLENNLSSGENCKRKLRSLY